MSQDYYQDFEQNNLFIEKVQGVLDGSLKYDDFMKIIDNREKQVKELREAFNDSISAETPFVREICMESIQNVDLCFDDYCLALDDMAENVANFNRSALLEIAGQIAEIYYSLNLAFLGFRNDALIARGPTSHAGINLLLNSMEGIKQGAETEEGIRGNIEMEKSTSEQALQMLSTSESNFFNDNMKTFYNNYLKTIKKFDEYFDIGKPQKPKEEKKEMSEWEKLQEKLGLIIKGKTSKDDKMEKAEREKLLEKLNAQIREKKAEEKKKEDEAPQEKEEEVAAGEKKEKPDTEEKKEETAEEEKKMDGSGEEKKEETEEERKKKEEIARKKEEIAKKKEEKIAEIQKQLEELGEQYKKIDIDYQIMSFSYEPTHLPMVNLVICSGRNFIEEKGEKGMFQYFLDELWHLFNGLK